MSQCRCCWKWLLRACDKGVGMCVGQFVRTSPPAGAGRKSLSPGCFGSAFGICWLCTTPVGARGTSTSNFVTTKFLWELSHLLHRIVNRALHFTPQKTGRWSLLWLIFQIETEQLKHLKTLRRFILVLPCQLHVHFRLLPAGCSGTQWHLQLFLASYTLPCGILLASHCKGDSRSTVG